VKTKADVTIVPECLQPQTCHAVNWVKTLRQHRLLNLFVLANSHGKCLVLWHNMSHCHTGTVSSHFASNREWRETETYAFQTWLRNCAGTPSRIRAFSSALGCRSWSLTAPIKCFSQRAVLQKSNSDFYTIHWVSIVTRHHMTLGYWHNMSHFTLIINHLLT